MPAPRLPLLLALGAVALLAGASAAEAQVSQVAVRNRAPQAQLPDAAAADVDAARPGVQVAPRAGALRSVPVQLPVDDDNGHNDVTRVLVAVYAADRATLHAAAVEAGKVSGSGKRGVWAANVSMRHHDPPGLYWLQAEARDRNGNAHAAWSNFTYDALAAVRLDRDEVLLNHGGAPDASVPPGTDTHAGPVPVNVTNQGNVEIDVGFSGTNLTNATSGERIPIGNLHLSLAPNMTAEEAFAEQTTILAASRVAVGADSRRAAYLAIHVPQGLPSGTYTGSVVITAMPRT